MKETFNVGEGGREPDVFGAVPAADRPRARPSSSAAPQPTEPSDMQVFDGGPSPAVREAQASPPIEEEADEEPTFDGGGAAT